MCQCRSDACSFRNVEVHSCERAYVEVMLVPYLSLLGNVSGSHLEDMCGGG